MFGLFGTDSPGLIDADQSIDKIVPLHYFDDAPLWRAFNLYSLFVFDDVLDAEKLRSSLERLINKDGWWKLGARLRRNENGALEYHVPASFSPKHPALAYSHIEHDIKASEHPLASRLPKPSKTPAVVGDPDEFLDLMHPAESPTKLSDYINSDRPQLGLHIVSFKDRTLVSIYWPHTLMDAMGKKALLKAWSLVLQGSEEKVTVPYGADFDPLENLGTKPTEPHKLASHRMGMFGLLSYGLGQVMNFFRKQETRIVCVPRSFLEKLRQQMIDELAEENDSSAEKPFLSEGDVLCAWWTRLAVAHLPRNSTQTVVLNNAYDLRKALKIDLLPEGSAYISNATGFINVVLAFQDIMEKPLSHVASAIRASITKLGTRPQVEAFSAMVRESPAKLPPFFGDRNMHMITFSNWTKANLFGVDFSAAVVHSSGDRPGRPVYIQNNQLGLTLPNGFPIIGKDSEGNYWLSGYMNVGCWARIEELLARER